MALIDPHSQRPSGSPKRQKKRSAELGHPQRSPGVPLGGLWFLPKDAPVQKPAEAKPGEPPAKAQPEAA